MANEIRNLEIFGSGTHRASTGTVTVTNEDLDQIVEAFNSLKETNIVRPHLKLGHTDAQKWFGQKDGIPSLGWISRVWRHGTKLLADVIDVPDALIDMIRAKRYHNVSAEVFWGAPIEHNGRRFTRVLSAVAILGTQMPAVKDLTGLANAIFHTEPMHQFTGAQAVTLQATEEDDPMPEGKDTKLLYSAEQHESLVAAAVAKAVKDAEAKFESDRKDLEKQVEVATQRAEQAEKSVNEVRATAAKAQAETLIDQAIKDGKLLPKQRDFALAFMQSDQKFKFGEGEKTMPELFSEFLEAAGKQIDTSEKGSGDTKKTEFTTAAEEVDHKTREAMKENSKLNYSDALDSILGADPDLRERYVNGQV